MNDVSALVLPGTCDVHISGGNRSPLCRPIRQQRKGAGLVPKKNWAFGIESLETPGLGE